VSRRDHLRASDDDRERIIARLHKAATEGRIVSEELEQRVAKALKARTYGELDETVADLPVSGARRGRREVPATRGSHAGWALTLVRSNPWLLLFAIPVVAVTTAMILAMTVIWAVVMVVVMVLGGRPSTPRAPWTYSRYGRRAFGPPPRRRTRSYWA
jgi:hypothetical protein